MASATPSTGLWFTLRCRQPCSGEGARLCSCRARSARRDEAGFVGEDDGLGAVAKIELGQDPADVSLGGLFGDDKGAADLGVGQAVGDQPQYLGLPLGERSEGGRERRAGGWL